MNKPLVINDLDMSKELDRAALAKVVGGRNIYGAGNWVRNDTTARLGGGWRRDVGAGGYVKRWSQGR